MVKSFISLFIFILSISLHADTLSFYAVSDKEVLAMEGDCTTRRPPCSTFKIALSLMGYDCGLLQNSFEPKIAFKEDNLEDCPFMLDFWYGEQTPSSWMKYSCVWYSQVLTKAMGLETFKSYVQALNYGNQDLSQKDALTRSWLSSTLAISLIEQVDLLQKLQDKLLPVSSFSHEATKAILLQSEPKAGVKLYGKTGAGHQTNLEGNEVQIGWFVGWLEKGSQSLTFACVVEEDSKHESPSSLRAKAIATAKALSLIDSIS